MIQYNTGILYAKTILDLLGQDEDFVKKYYIGVGTFCNGRENGYVLTIEDDSYEKPLYIWIHEHRNSDAIVVRHGGSSDRDFKNMYSENVYENNSVSFNFEPYRVIRYIKELVEEFFAKGV